MAAAELERRKVKSGYDLTVEIKPGMPLGRFTEDLMIDTNHPRRPGMKLTIAGTAIGPIRVVPDRLQMISVASHKGASKDLALIVRGDRETHFEAASRPEGLEVSITRDEKSGAKGRYRLTATVPPGTPPGVLSHPIVLKTHHPEVAEVKIPVSINRLDALGVGLRPVGVRASARARKGHGQEARATIDLFGGPVGGYKSAS